MTISPRPRPTPGVDRPVAVVRHPSVDAGFDSEGVVFRHPDGVLNVFWPNGCVDGVFRNTSGRLCMDAEEGEDMRIQPVYTNGKWRYHRRGVYLRMLPRPLQRAWDLRDASDRAFTLLCDGGV